MLSLGDLILNLLVSGIVGSFGRDVGTTRTTNFRQLRATGKRAQPELRGAAAQVRSTSPTAGRPQTRLRPRATPGASLRSAPQAHLRRTAAEALQDYLHQGTYLFSIKRNFVACLQFTYIF